MGRGLNRPYDENKNTVFYEVDRFVPNLNRRETPLKDRERANDFQGDVKQNQFEETESYKESNLL